MANTDLCVRASLRQYVSALGIWGWAVIACVILGDLAAIGLFVWGMYYAPVPDGAHVWIWLLFSVVILGLAVVPFIAFHRMRVSLLSANTGTPSQTDDRFTTASLLHKELGGVPEYPTGHKDGGFDKWMNAFSATVGVMFGQDVRAAFEREVKSSGEPGQYGRNAKYLIRAMEAMVIDGTEITPERICRPRIEIEFNRPDHMLPAGSGSAASFAVRNLSSTKLVNVHVVIARLRALEDITATYQLGSHFTGHELALMRNPRPRQEDGFSIGPDRPEIIKVAWTSEADSNIYFSGYTDKGDLREVGFKTLKTRYELTVVATADNADATTAVFRLGRDKNGAITMRKIDSRDRPDPASAAPDHRQHAPAVSVGV